MSALLVLSLTLAGGCAPEEEPPPPPPPVDDEPEVEEPDGLRLAIVEEWLESGHANVLPFPAGREGCVLCHDGGAFAQEIDDPAALDREFLVSIDCRACHVGVGPEIAAAGVVDLPATDNVQAGSGALCMSCHNARRAPDPADDGRAAPHYSAQADVLTASGGMPFEGIEYASSEPHETFIDTCLGCHIETHAFHVSYGSCQAAECHTTDIDLDTPAEADYDGDGEVGSFQQEVEGLLAMLEDALVDELDGGSFAVEAGAISFLDAAGDPIEVDDRVYAAAYNHVLAAADGSLGIHNPAFVISILQESFSWLTGEEHPGEPYVVE